MRSILVMLGVLLLAASPALGDEVRLKNGSIIIGKIVREDRDFVVVDLGRGRMNIARRDILSIKRTSSADPAPTDPGSRDPAARAGPPARETPPKAVPTKTDPAARAGAQTPRRRPRGATPSPKVVPVERTPPKGTKGTGPESASPSRKSASRATSAPTPNPDW